MGPLQGIHIIEFGGIGPGPFCGMMLSDMGADVIRIERRGGLQLTERACDFMLRNRRSVVIDLRRPEGVDLVLGMIAKSDALIEGFRPGVMERRGLGPDICLQRNPKLIYGRMTGWGQDGPLAAAAGHDINFTALSGALHAVGPRNGKPAIPLNLVGDFGGGGMLLALGMVSALLEAQRSHRGQVVDAAMTDGAALLMTMIYSLKAADRWTDRRGENLLDGGAPFYDTYETADGRYVAVGSIEPAFYRLLIQQCGIDDPALQDPPAPEKWPLLREKLRAAFKSRTRTAWCERLEGTDACFAPVLSMEEAHRHPHNAARKTFVDVAGRSQPAPAPRLSRTPAAIRRAPVAPGADTRAVLMEMGFSVQTIDRLKQEGVVDENQP